MRILTVNSGSTSLKLERYDLAGALPPIAGRPHPCSRTNRQSATRKPHSPPRCANGRCRRAPLRAAAGGLAGGDAARYGDVRNDSHAGADDRLHDTAALDAVESIRAIDPKVPQFAISDSTFHPHDVRRSDDVCVAARYYGHGAPSHRLSWIES